MGNIYSPKNKNIINSKSAPDENPLFKFNQKESMKITDIIALKTKRISNLLFSISILYLCLMPLSLNAIQKDNVKKQPNKVWHHNIVGSLFDTYEGKDVLVSGKYKFTDFKTLNVKTGDTIFCCCNNKINFYKVKKFKRLKKHEMNISPWSDIYEFKEYHEIINLNPKIKDSENCCPLAFKYNKGMTISCYEGKLSSPAISKEHRIDRKIVINGIVYYEATDGDYPYLCYIKGKKAVTLFYSSLMYLHNY